jgi:hypothetical protein
MSAHAALSWSRSQGGPIRHVFATSMVGPCNRTVSDAAEVIRRVYHQAQTQKLVSDMFSLPYLMTLS